jgi:hypothetical protein
MSLLLVFGEIFIESDLKGLGRRESGDAPGER